MVYESSFKNAILIFKNTFTVHVRLWNIRPIWLFISHLLYNAVARSALSHSQAFGLVLGK